MAADLLDAAATVSIANRDVAPVLQAVSAPIAVAGPSFAPPPKLEPFILLGKSARGAGAAKLIEEATAANGCYVFAELAQAAGVRELLEGDRHPGHAMLLRIFSYGTWTDYKNSAQNMPTLNAAQQAKLKQLSLVTLGGRSRRLPYDQLRHELDIGSDRELEDLIIDCIYTELLTGRLDQCNRRFDLDRILCARDVPETGLAELTNILGTWRNRVGALISELDELIVASREKAAHHKSVRGNHAARVQRVVADVTASTSGGKSTGGDGGFSGAARHLTSTVSNAFGGAKGGQDDVMDVDGADGGGASTTQSSPRRGKVPVGGRKRARN